MTRIMWDSEVRSMNDSIIKILPLTGDAGMNTAGSDAEATVEEKQTELLQAQQAVAQEKKNQVPEQEAPAMPPQATAGSEITGMKGGEQVANPTDQPGTETTAPPTVAITKSFFKDEFGISGSSLIELFKQAGENGAVPAVVKMLREEQHSILKQFDWWVEEDWNILKLHDNDFNMLLLYPNRLEYQLRKAVSGVKRADSEEERDEIWKGWHERLNAESRLSRRERTILEGTYSILHKNGDMNAATITSYGVDATSSEVAGLIKTHGWLYDLNPVGMGTKNDDKCNYYGITKAPFPIFLKHIDSFIGNLWEVGGELSISKTGHPRLILPFVSKRAEDYTNVLKSELGVESLMWEGQQFVFDGDYAVVKAVQAALPHLKKQRSEACVFLSALEGNENAGRLIAFEKAKPQKQVELMQTWNISSEGMDEWREVITNERR